MGRELCVCVKLVTGSSIIVVGYASVFRKKEENDEVSREKKK
jgi:hypothetical protein